MLLIPQTLGRTCIFPNSYPLSRNDFVTRCSYSRSVTKHKFAWHSVVDFDISTAEENEMSIWTILFVILLIAWLGGFTVFHVAGGLIHLLLVLAVISLILHFVMGRRTV